jgi:hypothetical protein
MNPVTAFLVGIALTSGTVLLALQHLRGSLQLILTDLCGTTERAKFWTAFSNLTLFFVPFALALDHQPKADSLRPAAFVIGDQIESAVIGLVASLVFLGFILSRFILRANPRRFHEGAAVASDAKQDETAI